MKTFGIIGTFEKVQLNLDVVAPDMETALYDAKKLKFSDFIKGSPYNYTGPRVTSIWEND